jgi:hypothetical protein
LWALVSILASLAVVVAGCAIIAVILFNPFNQRDTLVSTPIPTQAAIVPTLTPFPRPTLDPATAIPTARSTVAPVPMTIRVYDQGGGYRWSLFADAWKPGYLLRGLNFRTGTQYIAHTRGVSNLPCEEFDTYWNITSGRQPLPNFGRIVNPKAILIAGDYTVILATDCTRQGAALFLIDSKNTLRDVFPIIGGDALVNIDGRIFVALSGFAGGDQQYHWIELRISETEGQPPKLEQVDQYALDDADVVYRSAAYYAGVGLAYISARPGAEVLQIADVTSNTFAVRKSQFLSISLTDLGFDTTGTLYGLDRRNRAVVRFNRDLSNYTSIPLKGITPQSFTVAPDGHFVVAGYADPN